jgi:hypothetical protein
MSMFKVKQHERKPLSWWYLQFRNNRLDMTPTYQRRSNLWSPWKRAHLIDSVLNEFDVPKFYVADFTSLRSDLNEAKKPYAIVDGKQRFEAIFSFFAGDLALNSSFRFYDDPSIKVGDLRYAELKAKYPTLMARVEDFVPVVMSVMTDEPQMIEELFIRLNSGEPANSAERRNAMPGPIPAMIRELTRHPFFEVQIRFSTKRMQEFNLAAKLLLMEWRNGFVDTKASNLDQFVLRAAQEEDLSLYVEAQQRVFEGLEAMYQVFTPRDPLLSSQGQIPLYYWMVSRHPTYRRKFREFLEQFNAKLRENLELSRTDPEAADPELSSYYTSARTTNDQQSFKDRHRILQKRYRAFVREES